MIDCCHFSVDTANRETSKYERLSRYYWPALFVTKKLDLLRDALFQEAAQQIQAWNAVDVFHSWMMTMDQRIATSLTLMTDAAAALKADVTKKIVCATDVWTNR